MQSRLNLAVKFRESFRPFAPAVLAERASAYFDVPTSFDSPYMLVVSDVHPAHRVPADEAAAGFDRLSHPVSTIPAVTHVDGSARIQTVDERHGRFRKLLAEFERQTGTPVLVNTSFNVRDEPIVCTPADAVRCFLATDLDVLVVGDFVIERSEQTPDALMKSATEPTANTPGTTWADGSLVAFDRDPSNEFLRVFALGLGVLVALASWALASRGNVLPSAILGTAGVTVGAVGLAFPRSIRGLYLGWMTLFAPIGWGMTMVLLTAVYVVAITPIGMWLRWRGRDVLHSRFDREAATYWSPTKRARSASDYLRRH